MDAETITIQDLQEYIEKQMTKHRFKHTLGVVETAKDLAVIYGVDSNKVTVAALFHDLAKEFTQSQKREFCYEHNIAIDEFTDEHIHLIHGEIGACIARENFNVLDKDILNAINNHTFGNENMSDLEKIIYIADIIEPNRRKREGLDKLRWLAYTDLNQAMKWALEHNITYLNSKNKKIHPIIYSILKEYEQIDIDTEELNDKI